MHYSKIRYHIFLTIFAAIIIIAQATASSLQYYPRASGQVIASPSNNSMLTLPNNQTSGIWFNNAPGYKVNCVNQARFNGRSCVCTPPAKLNKIIETYDGSIVSTVWECRQVQDEYRYNDKE